MIIVQLMGGLANQMFQYAAGRRLAHKHQAILKLDLTALQNQPEVDTPRHFELDCFEIQAVPASGAEIQSAGGGGASSPRSLKARVKTFLKRPNFNVIKESGHRFDPALLNAPDQSFLIGHWQSERYFVDITEIIRGDFALKQSPDQANHRMLEQIKAVPAVSLHVRRSDYVANPEARKYHGLAPLHYYQQAIQKISGQFPKPHFFVFSDDPEWCKQNLKMRHPVTYVDHNPPDRGFEDMRLMSQCRHHILANSSFSWWGAWLNPNPNKIVVAPRQWFTDKGINTSDLIPPAWVRL